MERAGRTRSRQPRYALRALRTWCWACSRIIATGYNARGQIIWRGYANGTRLEQSYDARGWLASIALTRPAANETIWQRTLTRHLNGRIHTTRGNTHNDRWDYVYDPAGRLTRATNNPNSAPRTVNYTYDAADRLTFKTGVGAYTYPGPSAARPHAPRTAGSASLSYNAVGNLVSITNSPALEKTIVWDGLNRVVRVDRAGKRTDMAYGPDGARLTRTVSPTGGGGSVETHTFIEDFEIGPDGTFTKYPVADVKRIARTTYALALDERGSVRFVTGPAPDGPEITRLFYEPYGEPTRVPLVLAPAQETRSSLSERHDEDAGLTYLNARFYDPLLARFVQPDPLDPTPPRRRNQPVRIRR